MTGEEQPSPAREPAEAPRRKRERRASNYEEDLKEVRNLAKDDPRLIAMVVRSWMNKDGK